MKVNVWSGGNLLRKLSFTLLASTALRLVWFFTILSTASLSLRRRQSRVVDVDIKYSGKS